jgi:putative NADPH-quinone reductase
MGDYDKVVIGFPVWWYTAPTIINTFIEENDLSGKDVYIFVTSGGSGVDGSLKDLRAKYPEIKFVDGKRIQQVTDDLATWIS